MGKLTKMKVFSALLFIALISFSLAQAPSKPKKSGSTKASVKVKVNKPKVPKIKGHVKVKVGGKTGAKTKSHGKAKANVKKSKAGVKAKLNKPKVSKVKGN